MKRQRAQVGQDGNGDRHTKRTREVRGIARHRVG